MSLEAVAVDKVEDGEITTPGVISFPNSNEEPQTRKKFKWEEFWHLFSVWLFSATVVVTVLFMLSMVDSTRSSKGLIKVVIMRLDSLSLMFSLVLSAGLEQAWNNKKPLKYKITMLLEMALAILGLLLYLTYSILNIIAPNNPYLVSRYGVHLFYIIVSTLVVIGGFIVRAYEE